MFADAPIYDSAATALVVVLYVIAALGLLAFAAGMFFPAPTGRLLKAFPRSRIPALVLTALASAASGWIVYHAALGTFEFLKPAIPVLAVVLFAASAWALRELLAVRALAACILLGADPVLDAIVWAPDLAARNYATALVYVAIVAAAALLLHPWLWTRAVRGLSAHPALRRLVAILALLVAGTALFFAV